MGNFDEKMRPFWQLCEDQCEFRGESQMRDVGGEAYVVKEMWILEVN